MTQERMLRPISGGAPDDVAPAATVPAPAAPAAPAAPESPARPAPMPFPSGPIDMNGSPAATPPPAPESAPAPITDLEQHLTQATTEAEALMKALNLDPSSPDRPAPSPAPSGFGAPSASPRPAAATWGVEPTPTAPVPGDLEIGYTPLSDAEATELFRTWSNREADDAAAFKGFVGALHQKIAQPLVAQQRALVTQMKAMVENPEWAFQYMVQRTLAQKQSIDRYEQIDGFFKKQAPGVPTQLMWSYTDEAQAKHPTDIKAQIMYCLRRGLEAARPMGDTALRAAREAEASTRAATQGLPGGSTRTGGPAEDAPRRFLDQVRSAQPRG